MAFIGSLITTVRANVAPMVKAFKKAERRTRALRKDMKRLGGTFVKVAAAGIAIAGAALVAYTLKAFKAIDATAKLAAEMQIATEDLISFQLAAGLSGTNSVTLTKALARMARTVGEARAGITTGTKALEDFGINLQELQGLTTAQVFEEFAEKIKNIEDPMIQAAKASLIFGKAGQKLLTFLKLGKSGLAAVKKEAEALGLAFSAVDARKVEEANDAILKMQTVVQGIGNTIAISLAPVVTKIADDMGKFIKESGGIREIVEKNIPPLLLGLAKIVDALGLAKAAWKGFKVVVEGTFTSLISVAGQIQDRLTNSFRLTNSKIKSDLTKLSEEMAIQVNKDFDGISEGLKQFEEGKAFKKMSEFLKKMSDDSKKLKDNMKGTAEWVSIFGKEIEGFDAEFGEGIREMGKFLDEQKKVIDAAKRIFEETRTPLEAIEAEIKRINEIFSQGGFEGMEGAFERKIKELEKSRKKIEDALKITGPTKEGIGKLVESMIDNSVEASFGLKKKDKTKAREAGFKQIDVNNINVKGLAKFGSTDKKILDEQVKAREVLNKIEQNTKSGSGAKAV